MKKILAFCVLFFLVGCASKPKPAPAAATTTSTTPDAVEVFPTQPPLPPDKAVVSSPEPAAIPAPKLPDVKPTIPPATPVPKHEVSTYKAPAPGPIPPPPPTPTTKQ